MNFIADILVWFAVIYFASIPFIWAWMFYHKIKCRKIQDCSNRKCKYWQYCNHNYIERKKDEIVLRKKVLLNGLGLTEEQDEEY